MRLLDLQLLCAALVCMQELPHQRSALIAANSASRAAVAEVAIYATAFVARLVLQTLPGGGEYGAYITEVGAALIAQSGAKAVKLRDDLAAMCRLNREVMHPRHKENVEKLKQTLQQCGGASRQAYRLDGSA